MNRRRVITTLLTALLLLCALPAVAQLAALEFDPAKVPVATVFHFGKSQLDGSHSTKISVYMASPERIEALKWDEGGSEATLVIADMDWPRFSVRRFEGWRLVRGAAPERRATLEATGDRLTMSLMAEPITLSHWPWHAYDFDFTSLNLTLPHLAEPRGTFSFWRTDFIYEDPPKVAELGEVTLRFEETERRAGRKVHRYSISGPGLQDQRGTWWADARSGLLVEYELPVGDEPGYRDVRMSLQSSHRLDAAQWEAFKRQAIGEAPGGAGS
jgi:hypothetical protein